LPTGKAFAQNRHGDQNARQRLDVADHRGPDGRNMAGCREEGQKPKGRAKAGKGQPNPSLNRPRRGPCAKAGGQGGKRGQGDKARIDHDLDRQFFLLSSTDSALY
jgi:hypothetical protein